MAVTSLENTTWKFNGTVNPPNHTRRMYVCADAKSTTVAQVLVTSTFGDSYGYPTVTTSYIPTGKYYSLSIYYASNVMWVNICNDNGSKSTLGNALNSLSNGYIHFFDGLSSATSTTDLIEWLEANATLVEEETTPTEITYNGATTSLEAGQTATLACNGKKAKSDIVVAFGAAGTVTYNGTETAVSAGQTATMACNGKKMKTDVVIAV